MEKYASGACILLALSLTIDLESNIQYLFPQAILGGNVSLIATGAAPIEDKVLTF